MPFPATICLESSWFLSGNEYSGFIKARVWGSMRGMVPKLISVQFNNLPLSTPVTRLRLKNAIDPGAAIHTATLGI